MRNRTSRAEPNEHKTTRDREGGDRERALRSDAKASLMALPGVSSSPSEDLRG